ncbi:MAG: aldehyde dehydrogenase family protein [Calothrix sp. SM1_7_51]|nr:aldehyde dehydrogenase family protein [Calothrix sp. SM1_7_51]
MTPLICQNYIDGKWVNNVGGSILESRNPAYKNEVVATFPRSTSADVDAVVDSARQAYRRWRLVPPPARAEYIQRVGEILREQKEELALLLTREMGKPLAEARGDIQEDIDCAFYSAAEGRRMFVQTTPSEMPNKFAMTGRSPIGVCALITPWNFPIAIPCWKAMPALVWGNTIFNIFQ